MRRTNPLGSNAPTPGDGARFAMVPRTTLNAANLAALGAPRLAELLLEISAGDAGAKRRLRLELAGAANPGEVGREVRKRLAAIARAQSFVEWPRVKALADDLETQRRAIAEQVAKHDPAEAMDLMWRFLALANDVFARCDDSSGVVGKVFHQACLDLGPLTTATTPEPRDLAERIFHGLTESQDRKSTRLNSSHIQKSRMPSSA